MANISITYTDFKQIEADAVKLAAVKNILETTFPDDTCALIAVKAVIAAEVTDSDTSTSTSDNTSESTTSAS